MGKVSLNMSLWLLGAAFVYQNCDASVYIQLSKELNIVFFLFAAEPDGI